MNATTATRTQRLVLCPSCSNKGRSVKPITIESLVTETARARVGLTDGFRFCAEPSCDVAYFHLESGDRFMRSDVNVRIGQKETSAPRPVCYCFDHTVEDIADEVAKTGTSKIADEITQKCRQGLDRCEETNPQGACCLGNVRQAVRMQVAQARHKGETPQKRKSKVNVGAVAQVGALVSAVAASACCWLPLLLIAVGISGGTLAATFEAWRPVLLPVTFALLSLAFYFTYRKPRRAATSAAAETDAEGDADGDACCVVPGADKEAEACCPPDKAKRFTLKKFNKVLLWVITAFVLAFAFFPNYVGFLIAGGGDTLAARDDLQKVVVKIDGMTCEACAARATSIERSLRELPGVVAAEVNYEKKEAVVGLPKGGEVPRDEILAAIAAAGNFTGRFVDQMQWTLAIDGMTCQGCAAHIQASLSKIPGVYGASASYKKRQATVFADPTLTEESLRKAVSDAGYILKSAVTEGSPPATGRSGFGNTGATENGTP